MRALRATSPLSHTSKHDVTVRLFRSLHTDRKTAAYALTAGFAAVLIILALIPLPANSSVPGTDKAHHFIAFAALVFPTALLYPRALW